MAREALRAETGLSPQTFDALLGSLDGIVQEGAKVRLATHAVALSPAEQQVRDAILDKIEGSGFTPPLAKELDANPALLRALTERGEVVKVGDFYLTKTQAAEARSRVRAEIEHRGPLTVAQIRDLLATSRKYAVPLCEWLDSTGATRRQGDVRVLGPKP